MEQEKKKIYLILHNVRSAYNVGSIFRTADGAGVEHIFLTGYTPAPPTHQNMYTTKPERMIMKTALGAQDFVSWTQNDQFDVVAQDLRKKKVDIIALEQGDGSVDYDSFTMQNDTAIILGNEPMGIEQHILQKCDAMIEIPMFGKKNSLNVAVAAGIALYELQRLSNK